jgi:hypothetical protein
MTMRPPLSCLRRRAGRAVLALALGAAAAVAPVALAQAGSFVSPGLDARVAEADTVIVGRARAVQSVWAGRNLYTRYTVEVQETLMGAPARELVVVVEGGVDMNRKHPIVVTVVAAPVLRRDEPVLLLLARDGSSGEQAHRIVGFNQGRIRLPAGTAEPGSDRAAPPWRGRLQEAIGRRSARAAAPAATPIAGASRPAVRRNASPTGGLQR